MNSMGVSPYVNRIYNDLTNGLIIFQLYDIIKPGTVDWKRVIQKFNKMRMMMEKIGKFTSVSHCLWVKVAHIHVLVLGLQCFDAVGWVAGRASCL